MHSQKLSQETRRRRFEELAQEQGAAFLRAAVRLTGEVAEAEDLLQETLVKAYLAFEQFTPGTNFRAWVLRILANTHISRFRHEQRLPATISWEELGANTQRGVFDPPGKDKGPEEEALGEALDAEVGPALARLPEEFRSAVILSDMFELSYQEIARALGVPLGTVRSRIFRGRKLLRESLREYARDRRLI
jgi:RNA polymerase sigma-70 factor, ECF subfamily